MEEMIPSRDICLAQYLSWPSSWNRQCFGKRDPRQTLNFNFLQASDESLMNGKLLHYTCIPVLTVNNNYNLSVLHSSSLLPQYWKVLFCKKVEQERFWLSLLFQVQPTSSGRLLFLLLLTCHKHLYFHSFIYCESNCFSSFLPFTALTVVCFNCFSWVSSGCIDAKNGDASLFLVVLVCVF